ncbi:recombination regulator RecX [Streptococcus sp. zg-JUN1979]|uniref:recombination regulator RecX n=1 Tax=Streptococcus sp. zg-JUN1979 TaxID=3391450 RepID=UPI0039A558D0
MKITKLEKKKRLYLLELDNSESLYITEDTIVRFLLSKHMTISTEELEDIKAFAQVSYGKNLALYYLSFKPRTQKEVSDYLYQHDIEEEIIPDIIAQLKTDNWINDKRYTETYISQKLLNGNKGPYALQKQLRQKGIATTLIDQALQEADFQDVLDKLSHKLLNKYQAKLPLNALKDKLTQALMSKGFSYDDAKGTIDRLELEKDDDDELELLQKELEKRYRNYSRRYDGYQLKQKLTQALLRKGYDYASIRSQIADYLD